MIEQLIGIVFPIFGLVAVGYFYARKHAPNMTAANKVNLEIFTPAWIFSVLSGEDFELAAYADLAFAGAIVVMGSGLIAWPIARLAGWSVKVFVPPMMFTNSGNMGLPLALLAFGEAALPAAMILFLVENTLHFTVGNAMLEGRVHPLVLLRMPMLQATLAGLVVAVFGIGVWKPLAVALDLLGQVAIGHGVTDCHDGFAHFFEDLDDLAAGLGFAAAGANCADRHDRFGGFDHGVGGADNDKISTGGRGNGGFVHHLRMGDIAVGKGHQVHSVGLDQLPQFFVGMNGNSVRIKRAGQICRVAATIDVGNLGRGECHYPIAAVVPEIDIEVVKITTGGAHDDDIFDSVVHCG